MPIVVMRTHQADIRQAYGLDKAEQVEVLAVAHQFFLDAFGIVQKAIAELTGISLEAIVPDGDYYGVFCDGRHPLEIEIQATVGHKWGGNGLQIAIAKEIRDRLLNWMHCQEGDFIGWTVSVCIRLTEGAFVE